MINTSLAVQSFLRSNPILDGFTGGRIYANVELPPSYLPEVGPALLLSPRGGTVDHSGQILTESFQFQAFAIEPGPAWDIYRATFDALQYKWSGADKIKGADLEQAGQLLTRPDTDWYFILFFFKLMFVNSE